MRRSRCVMFSNKRTRGLGAWDKAATRQQQENPAIQMGYADTDGRSSLKQRFHLQPDEPTVILFRNRQVTLAVQTCSSSHRHRSDAHALA